MAKIMDDVEEDVHDPIVDGWKTILDHGEKILWEDLKAKDINGRTPAPTTDLDIDPPPAPALHNAPPRAPTLEIGGASLPLPGHSMENVMKLFEDRFKELTDMVADGFRELHEKVDDGFRELHQKVELLKSTMENDRPNRGDSVDVEFHQYEYATFAHGSPIHVTPARAPGTSSRHVSPAPGSLSPARAPSPPAVTPGPGTSPPGTPLHPPSYDPDAPVLVTSPSPLPTPSPLSRTDVAACSGLPCDEESFDPTSAIVVWEPPPQVLRSIRVEQIGAKRKREKSKHLKTPYTGTRVGGKRGGGGNRGGGGGRKSRKCV